MNKRCRSCKSEKPLTDYYRYKNSPDGRMNSCKECMKKTSLQYRSRQREEKIQETPEICVSCPEPLALSRTGKRRKCKSCKDRVWEENKRRQGLDPELLRRHNIPDTEENRERRLAIWSREIRSCDICGCTEEEALLIEKKKLHLDHAHVTGDIRGLLCSFCNRGLGMFKDKRDLLEKAALYLRAHDPIKTT